MYNFSYTLPYKTETFRSKSKIFVRTTLYKIFSAISYDKFDARKSSQLFHFKFLTESVVLLSTKHCIKFPPKAKPI